MLSKQDKQILTRLRTKDPEAYDFFRRREAEHENNIQYCCHDVRNLVTLLCGSYQLIGLSNPQLVALPRWNQLGNDINSLITAFNDIAAYRYAGKLTTAAVPCEHLIDNIKSYIGATYPDRQDQISLISSFMDNTLSIDLTRITTAACCLVNNAMDAADLSLTDTIPVRIRIIEQFDGMETSLIITVANIGNPPEKELIPVLYRPFKSNKPGHLGLGLAIAAETADAAKGSLTWDYADSLCRFILKIPC